jgi:hypothetical protein
MNTIADDPFDYEKRWYEIMATINQDEYKDIQNRLKVDLVDVSRGMQCGLNSEGLPYVSFLLAGQKSVRTFLYAYDAIVDHGCPDALLTVLHLWSPIAYLIRRQLLPQLSDEVRNMADPFEHGEGL